MVFTAGLSPITSGLSVPSICSKVPISKRNTPYDKYEAKNANKDDGAKCGHGWLSFAEIPLYIAFSAAVVKGYF